MIDLHCHLLPGIDDGAPDLETALAMARIAVADGITVTACTPHIYPGLYENNAVGIRKAIATLQMMLDRQGIALRLVDGADAHVVPELVDGLKTGRIPTLAGSRYFLFEPAHHVATPRLEETAFNAMAAGFIPVVTHPERLTWIESHYAMFQRLAKAGAWMQLTAGAVTGRFGRKPQYWAEKMLDEGIVAIIATDAHRADRRPPLLAEARDAAAKRLGADEATHLVCTRPQGILDHLAPNALPPLPASGRADSPTGGWWRRLFGAA
ncbi:MAG TPA: CpsB/CapC family capsule biosynthesis tyrosine phosphatase [Patescibacteria group bacterium]|nr:CpsB/CapC family capsule biosynthesis tyrosine phosphatase [Patescibacteria group bacterium]